MSKTKTTYKDHAAAIRQTLATIESVLDSDIATRFKRGGQAAGAAYGTLQAVRWRLEAMERTLQRYAPEAADVAGDQGDQGGGQ